MKLFDDVLYPWQRRFVLHPARRKIWLSSRQCGKSEALASMLVYKANLPPGRLSLCVSTGQRAASEIVKKCARWAEAVRILSKGAITYTASAESVRFSTGGRILSLPNSPQALRGFTASCVCVDEAAFVDNLEDVLQAIAPTLTRDPDAELVLTSTPAGRNGKFYEMWDRAGSDPDWYVQTTTIHDAVAEGLNVNIEALRSLCPDPDVFACEYECRFMDQFGGFLDPSELVFADVPEGLKESYGGFDVARSGDNSAVADLAKKGEILYLRDAVLMKGVKYQDQIDAVGGMFRNKGWSSCYVDAVGLGGPVAEALHDKVSARIKPFTWTASNKTPAYEKVRSLVFDRKLVFAPHLKDLIIRDFQGISRVVTPDGKVKFVQARTDAGHCDLASALVLAVQAAVNLPLGATQPRPAPFSSSFRPLPQGVFA